MKAAIYVRTAATNHEQADRLIKECEDYANKFQYEVVCVYSDFNKSGLNERRPMFQKLMKETDKWDILIIPTLSVIGRNLNIVFDFVNKMQYLGKQIIFVKEGLKL